MSVIFTTAEEAEEAFYEAIGRGDIESLMAVWADDEEIACIHPTGQLLNGASAIRKSWSAIFANNPSLTVHVKRNIRWIGAIIAVHVVVETLFIGDESTPHGPMLSTNVFQRGASGWRLLSHHTTTATDIETSPTSKEADNNRLHTLH